MSWICKFTSENVLLMAKIIIVRDKKSLKFSNVNHLHLEHFVFIPVDYSCFIILPSSRLILLLRKSTTKWIYDKKQDILSQLIILWSF